MTSTVAAEKKAEKVEKRRALGRGLASLLPGPRVVADQGLKPESFSPQAGTASAVPFPSSPAASEAGAEGRSGVGEPEIPSPVPSWERENADEVVSTPAAAA